MSITRGAVKVRDASGVWHPAIAVSGVEGTHRDGRKIHDFPVVWIVWPRDPSERQWPWPAEAVEQADADWWNSRVASDTPAAAAQEAAGAADGAGVGADSPRNAPDSVAGVTLAAETGRGGQGAHGDDSEASQSRTEPQGERKVNGDA